MKRQTITIDIATLDWTDNFLVDWGKSTRNISTDGKTGDHYKYNIPFSFDRAISSTDGVYSVVYKNLGTKGLVLKNGNLFREINRSYYHAEVYEYPITLVKLNDGRDILIHCPEDYCQIEFEEVETGLRLSSHENRDPSDFFHSRFEISPDNKTLLSRGWVWHPYDYVALFDINECIENPQALDNSKYAPDVAADICTASFTNNELVLIGSSKDGEILDDEHPEKLSNGQIAIWNIKTNEVSGIIQPNFNVGAHLIAIDEAFAWELYEYPKIVNFRTGEIVDEIKDINSGKQISSIIYDPESIAKIAFNRKTRQVAISNNEVVEILTK